MIESMVQHCWREMFRRETELKKSMNYQELKSGSAEEQFGRMHRDGQDCNWGAVMCVQRAVLGELKGLQEIRFTGKIQKKIRLQNTRIILNLYNKLSP